MNPLAILIGAIVGAVGLIKLATRTKEVRVYGDDAPADDPAAALDDDPLPADDPPTNVDRRNAPDPEPEAGT